jgi:serine/threonine protein kinase
MQGTMAVAHAHGVVHADLKPENILLHEAVGEGSIECPQVVITDFGSAFSTSETDIARVAFEMQTLPYRAPEVLILCALPACTIFYACIQALHRVIRGFFAWCCS